MIAEGGGDEGHGILVSGVDNTISLLRVTFSDNRGNGVFAKGGSVKIAQSYFTNNHAGGLRVRNSTFDISNSIFFLNGSPTSTSGGVRFEDITTSGNRFEFNTVAYNLAGNTVVSGVQCSVISRPLRMSNLIVYSNTQFNESNPDQVGDSPNCIWTYSIIGPKAFIGGTELSAADPQFIEFGDSNLKSTSPALNAADPATTLNVDFYGKPRPVGGRADIGAIEAQ